MFIAQTHCMLTCEKIKTELDSPLYTFFVFSFYPNGRATRQVKPALFILRIRAGKNAGRVQADPGTPRFDRSLLAV